MSETWMLLLAFIGGLLLGAFFYGGLWWTVQKGIASQRPALWFFVSYMLRTGLTMAGLYYISGGRWQQLLICLLGCIMARFTVMRLGSRTEPSNLSQEAGHAA